MGYGGNGALSSKNLFECWGAVPALELSFTSNAELQGWHFRVRELAYGKGEIGVGVSCWLCSWVTLKHLDAYR